MPRNVLKWQTYLFGASFLQHPWASGAVPSRCFFDRFCCTTTWFWVIPCSNRFGLVRMKSCHVSGEVVRKTGEKLSRFVTVHHHLKFEGFEKSYIYFNRLGQDDAVNAPPQIWVQSSPALRASANTDTSLLRTVCFVPGERKPFTFSLNSTRFRIQTPR